MPGRLDEIKAYLMQGTPHICHYAALHGRPETGIHCRGGRNWQLQIWHRMGLLTAPTDAALHEMMIELELWKPPIGEKGQE